jgi:hypothetical protein
MAGRSPQGLYWIATIAEDHYTGTDLPAGVAYIKGQMEVGEGGFRHWQLLIVMAKKIRLVGLKLLFPRAHLELTRSAAADEYVWKEETRVAGSQFELGNRAVRRNVATDWEKVLSDAKSGTFDAIPADIQIRCYNQLSRIRMDHAKPVALVRTTVVYHGPTGTGKTRRAWDEAGLDAYAKDPCTKWWCGYQGQKHVIIDEFRGLINISHLLRWLDRYPVMVETKGAAVPLAATTFWITSNLPVEQWYRDADDQTVEALKRRLNIILLE